MSRLYAKKETPNLKFTCSSIYEKDEKDEEFNLEYLDSYSEEYNSEYGFMINFTLTLIDLDFYKAITSDKFTTFKIEKYKNYYRSIENLDSIESLEDNDINEQILTFNYIDVNYEVSAKGEPARWKILLMNKEK